MEENKRSLTENETKERRRWRIELGVIDDGLISEWMDGWMDERMDGRMDGWMDGWMDGRAKEGMTVLDDKGNR